MHKNYCYYVTINNKIFFEFPVGLLTQPPISDKVTFKQEMTDLEISEGEDAKFDVRVDGVDVQVDWYKDDELLEDAGRIIIEDPHPESDDNLYSLTIENCAPKDSGIDDLSC